MLARPLARHLGLVSPHSNDKRGVIFYAVSHGELLLVEKFLPRFVQRNPDCEPILVVPATSIEKLARQRLGQYRCECISPIGEWAATTALHRLRPAAFVVVEFARIPTWIRAAKQRGIPLAIFNGRLGEKNQRLYRRSPHVFRQMIGSFDKILVQTASDAEDFGVHGARPTALAITGALKFDVANFDRQTPTTERLARLAGFRPDDVVLVAGSTREGEEAVLISILQRLLPKHSKLRGVIVPRNHHRFEEVAGLLSRSGLPFQRRSRLETEGADPQARVLLVDTLGELAAWWGTARIGFVGASLTSSGGQNMIEPAALGVATCFGPHTANFRDVVSLLLAQQAAVEVADAAELEAFFRRCLQDPAYAAALGARGQAACRRQSGALDHTLRELESFLTGPLAADNRHAA